MVAFPVVVAEEAAAVAGKSAGLVVADRNLLEIPASDINEATVLQTIFDGRTDYERTSN